MSNLPREDDSQNVPQGPSQQKKYTASDNFTRLESRKDDAQKLADKMASTKRLQLSNDTLRSEYTEFKDSADARLKTDKLPETHNGGLGGYTDELSSHTDELTDHTDELGSHTDKLKNSIDVLREITRVTGNISIHLDPKTDEDKFIEQMIKDIQDDPDHSDTFKENVLKLIFYWKEAQEDLQNEQEAED